MRKTERLKKVYHKKRRNSLLEPNKDYDHDHDHDHGAISVAFFFPISLDLLIDHIYLFPYKRCIFNFPLPSYAVV